MNDLQPILEEFGVQAATLEPLTSTENNNHRVSTSTGEQFLLRQHQSESHSLGALESEMIWLNHLHSHNLEVQRPVALESGNFIAVADAKRFSLLTWLEGEVVEELNASQAEALGALMARLHAIAQDFKLPVGFERLRYDTHYLEHQLNVLRGVPWLEPDMALFVAAMTRAKTGFEDTTTWGLIHADLHPGNVIVQGTKVAAIDFDRCGFGPVMFDLVSALGYLEDDSRKAFLSGYSTVLPLPTGFEERRSLFTIAEWLTNLAFLALRSQDREYVDSVMLPGLREQLPKMLEK